MDLKQIEPGIKLLWQYSLMLALSISIPIITHCQQVQIDHVISVVTDLDQAADDLTQKGFTIKAGTLHPNGLKNALIKFKNKSSFELMTVESEAKDKMAKDYQNLLDQGEGGVFLALNGLNRSELEAIFINSGIDYKISAHKLWTYFTFRNNVQLQHIFFIIYHFDVTTQDKFTIHHNGFNQICDVVIEGNEGVINLLEAIGLESNKSKDSPTFQTKTGNITVVSSKNDSERPGIVSISFCNDDSDEKMVFPLH